MAAYQVACSVAILAPIAAAVGRPAQLLRGAAVAAHLHSGGAAFAAAAEAAIKMDNEMFWRVSEGVWGVSQAWRGIAGLGDGASCSSSAAFRVLASPIRCPSSLPAPAATSASRRPREPAGEWGAPQACTAARPGHGPSAACSAPSAHPPTRVLASFSPPPSIPAQHHHWRVRQDARDGAGPRPADLLAQGAGLLGRLCCAPRRGGALAARVQPCSRPLIRGGGALFADLQAPPCSPCSLPTAPAHRLQALQVPTEVYSLLNAATFATLTNVSSAGLGGRARAVAHCLPLKGTAAAAHLTHTPTYPPTHTSPHNNLTGQL